MLGRYSIELDDGRVADSLQYVVVFHSDLHKALECAGSAGLVGVIMADMQVTNMGHHHQNNT
jgi:hypothetical protein